MRIKSENKKIQNSKRDTDKNIRCNFDNKVRINKSNRIFKNI
jgi:hypothetical protein